MTEAKRHLAGRATYRGDHRHIIGEVKGPTTYGIYTVATAAAYDHETDRTVVTFAYATPEDLAAATPIDVHGTVAVPGVAS